MTPEYSCDLAELSSARPELAKRIDGFRTLEHILDWIQRDGLSFAGLDLVAQDEYSHDLLMPVGPDWLAFGMT
jgi:hypothetical protein